MIRFGTITISDIKLVVMPEDYSLFDRGNKSQIIATSNGGVLDVGYGVTGFTANGWLTDPLKLKALDDIAKDALLNGTPLIVADSVYPGGRSWTGFLERPVIKGGGQAFYSGALDLPAIIMLVPVPITFYSSEIGPI